MQWGVIAGMSGVAAVTAVAVSGPEVVRYPLPESVARERLAAAPLPEPLLALSGKTVVLLREEGGLTWMLGAADNRSVGRVTLAGDGAATDVTIEFELSDMALGAPGLSRTRFSRAMFENMFREHVDALLSGRPFDANRSMMGLAQEIQSDPAVMREFGQALGDQFNEVATMLNESEDFATMGMPMEPAVDGREAVAPNPEATRPTTRL